MDKKDLAIAVLSILLILSVASSLITYHYQQQIIENQLQIIRELSTNRGVSVPITPATPATPVIPTNTGSFTQERSAYANIVAVRSDTNEGVIGKVRVEIKNGTGRVLANTKPFVEPDTQYSVRTAVKVATKYTHSDMNSMDFIVSFDINGTLIGGPSAGAAITLSLIHI